MDAGWVRLSVSQSPFSERIKISLCEAAMSPWPSSPHLGAKDVRSAEFPGRGKKDHELSEADTEAVRAKNNKPA